MPTGATRNEHKERISLQALMQNGDLKVFVTGEAKKSTFKMDFSGIFVLHPIRGQRGQVCQR
jgi:hypothetical protein